MLPPDGGLALWVELPQRASSELALAASAHKLLLTPGPRFSADRTQTNRLRLPLTLPPAVIGAAVMRLVAAWDDVVGGVRGGVGRDAVAL